MYSVAFSPDGSRIVSGDASGHVTIDSWMTSLPPQLHLSNVTILRATAAEGAGLFLGAGRASARSSTLTACAAGSGGALTVDGGSLTLEVAHIINNSVQSGAAVWLRNASFRINDSTFSHNDAPVTLQYDYATSLTPSTLATSTFAVNVGATAVLASAPIAWTCEPGTWMSHTGSVDESTCSGCPYNCSKGFVGTFTNATLSACSGPW